MRNLCVPTLSHGSLELVVAFIRCQSVTIPIDDIKFIFSGVVITQQETEKDEPAESLE